MSVHSIDSTAPRRRAAANLTRLREVAHRGEKIAMLTCHESTFVRVLDAAGVDVTLVGDPLVALGAARLGNTGLIDKREF